MRYNSTRDSGISLSAEEVIVKGISDDGGLFVPENIPTLTADEMDKLPRMDYIQCGSVVLSKFLTGFTADEIQSCLQKAYTKEKFGGNPAPLTELNKSAFMLELWHGPTCAFKDMALQLLPHLLSVSMKKTGGDRVLILVATSGDTGKAALEGFRDADGTEIVVFYPQNGVSDMQKLQMITQEGSNVKVYGIDGNFDDAQTAVKNIFADKNITKILKETGRSFSSANSINWGRLVPQIIYYVQAYVSLVGSGKIKQGERINYVVPTGNFGNILSAYYAKKMGIPVNKLICASNSNNILTDFISHGVYDRNRRFITTLSPSMDIIISSNLERLLYDICGRDSDFIRTLFAGLAADGRYEISDSLRTRLQSEFYGGYCDDAATKKQIAKTFGEYGYTLDTHTAVATAVYEEYAAKTGDSTKTVIASTASIYKFPHSVLESLGGNPDGDPFTVMQRLKDICGVEIPPQLLQLKNAVPRFNQTISPENMGDVVASPPSCLSLWERCHAGA